LFLADRRVDELRPEEKTVLTTNVHRIRRVVDFSTAFSLEFSPLGAEPAEPNPLGRGASATPRGHGAWRHGD
jgi:hypothetical protein